jgi:hypothetical protein
LKAKELLSCLTSNNLLLTKSLNKMLHKAIVSALLFVAVSCSPTIKNFEKYQKDFISKTGFMPNEETIKGALPKVVVFPFDENGNVVARFGAKNPQFQPLSIADVAATCPGLTPAGRERISTLARGHQLQLSPRRTGTDGFFIALFERRP